MSFKWSLKQVKVKDIKLNPDNPKIRNEKGFERLRKSLEKFGHIFDGIMNTDNNLIDGHSRIELMKPSDTATVFIPDRKLTKKQYNELVAVFDIATAGEPDYEIIMEILGEEGAEAWGIENLDYLNSLDENDEWADVGEFKINTEKDLKLILYFDNEEDRKKYIKKNKIEIHKTLSNQFISYQWEHKE